MAENELQALVLRRLHELAITPEQASQLADGAVAPETIRQVADGARTRRIGARLARALAVALGVPENRVRRAAGLQPVPDPRESIETGPHLRVIRGGR
jgi:hypothetical protein